MISQLKSHKGISEALRIIWSKRIYSFALIVVYKGLRVYTYNDFKPKKIHQLKINEKNGCTERFLNKFKKSIILRLLKRLLFWFCILNYDEYKCV